MSFKQVYENFKISFDDSNDHSPLQLKYIEQLRFLMSTLGSWPYREFGRRRLDTILSIYNLVLICASIVTSTACGAYLWVYRHILTFFDMGHIVLTTALGVLYVTRIVFARTDKFGEIVKEWLLEFHLYYFKGRSEYAAKVSSQIHTISGVFSLYLHALLWCGFILFNFQPWYNNYSKGMFTDHRPENATFEHAAYYYFGTEKPYTHIKDYWILFTVNLFICYYVACTLLMFDLLLSLIVFQIWGHLKILKNNLLSFPLPDSGRVMYSATENISIRKLLKENIIHHNVITDFVNKCSDTFTEYLFILYFFLQIISCVLLLEISSLTTEAFAKYGPLTVGMYQQLIQVSVLFEMLNTKSEQLIDAVYEVPWECMDTSNRRTVMLLLHRVQTPLSLKAGKVVPVGVRTMFAVLKTSFSYFMMLITMAKEK